MHRLLRSSRAACDALNAVACAAAAAVCLIVPGRSIAHAQITPAPALRDSVTIAAGKRYRATSFHRWWVGSDYRDLWMTPIRVPVLEISTYAGGLHPKKEGGGLQTKSLRFTAKDGSEYVFRLTDKSVNGGHEDVQGTPINGFFQDQVSAMHPAAAAIAAPIVDASGVLHPNGRLMVMGQDPALGEFSKDFVGRLGVFEEYPNVPDKAAGFGGATKIIDSEELLKLIDTEPGEHIDAPMFLTARLTDFIINDNDRHLGNWKWARLKGAPKNEWEPIARDRDHAFVSYEGVLLGLARKASPGLVTMSDVPDVTGLTQTLGFDARLLGELEKPVWDSVTRALQAKITDSVIDAAVHAMPPEYGSSRATLAAMIKKRRDGLPKASTDFYLRIAARVDVHATDAGDRATINRVSDGIVDVKLESGGKTYYSRRFDARETREILVYLHNGSDTAVVSGKVQNSIIVRVIGGNGMNVLVDSSTVNGRRDDAHFYDRGLVSGVTYGLDTLFDRRPWQKEDGVLVPPSPDYGSSILPVVDIGSHRHTGITPLLGLVRYGYGFRDIPYSSMLKLTGEYALSFGGARVTFLGDKRLEDSPWHFTAMARMSEFEVVNWAGLGNTTPDSANGKYFEVRQTQYMIRPAISFSIGSRTEISAGATIEHAVLDSLKSPFVEASHPYGFGTFNEASVYLNAHYEWRKVREDLEHTHHRVLVDFNAAYFPAAMDVRSAFESVSLSTGASITVPMPLHPFFVFRAGGKKLWGDFPFFEAAMIGGAGTTRYMDTERYAGDASLYGSSELRVPLVHFRIFMPLRAGLVGLADAGRVYVDGDSPGGWHSNTGEGIWFGRGDLSSVLTLTRTTELGHAGFHVRLGLNF